MGKYKRQSHLEDLRVGGRIILKWILKKYYGWGLGLDLSGAREGKLAGCFEHGNEPSGSIKCGNFVD
jgi:hypothetical protein